MSYPRSFEIVKAESRQVGHAQDDRHRQLRQGILFQPPKELGADLVAGSEEKRSKNMAFTIAVPDVELPDQNARQQRAHNGP